LQAHGVRFTGKTILDLYPSSKVGEMTTLVLDGVAYPMSFYACNAGQLPALFAWAHEQYGLDFPIVVKGSRASKGEHNHLVRSLDELQSLDLETNGEYLMQVAIPNQCDYRVLVMGNEVKVVIRRTRIDKNSHLNNTSQGATADLLPEHQWPAGLTELSVHAAKALGRDDIAGVDILIDEKTGELYVLEVNKTPHMAIGAPNVIKNKLSALYEYLHELSK
jgi:glutathione synthase/RimK-type ligase-like ATP-grasp enzyme